MSKTKALTFKLINFFTLVCFCGSMLLTDFSRIVLPAYAATLNTPAPENLVPLSQNYSLPVLKGLRLDPKNPMQFEFIIDAADQQTVSEEDASDIIKYFLAGLTIPQEDIWVNLSPYEKDRITSPSLAQTDTGKDLLSQDFILKQLSASLTYPETTIGKKFWDKINTVGADLACLPVRQVSARNFFNKIWIAPDTCEVYEEGDTAYLTKATLKTMMEEDYLAMKNNPVGARHASPVSVNGPDMSGPYRNNANFATQIMREVILPQVNQDVNSGKNFAKLRQIYHSLVMALWFKKHFQATFYKNYFDKNKIAGIDLADKNVKEKIYRQYLKAFRKGVYNYIKKESGLPASTPGVGNQRFKAGTPGVESGKTAYRRYFSGGFVLAPVTFSPGHARDQLKKEFSLRWQAEKTQASQTINRSRQTHRSSLLRLAPLAAVLGLAFLAGCSPKVLTKSPSTIEKTPLIQIDQITKLFAPDSKKNASRPAVAASKVVTAGQPAKVSFITDTLKDASGTTYYDNDSINISLGTILSNYVPVMRGDSTYKEDFTQKDAWWDVFWAQESFLKDLRKDKSDWQIIKDYINSVIFHEAIHIYFKNKGAYDGRPRMLGNGMFILPKDPYARGFQKILKDTSLGVDTAFTDQEKNSITGEIAAHLAQIARLPKERLSWEIYDSYFPDNNPDGEVIIERVVSDIIAEKMLKKLGFMGWFRQQVTKKAKAENETFDKVFEREGKRGPLYRTEFIKSLPDEQIAAAAKEIFEQYFGPLPEIVVPEIPPEVEQYIKKSLEKNSQTPDAASDLGGKTVKLAQADSYKELAASTLGGMDQNGKSFLEYRFQESLSSPAQAVILYGRHQSKNDFELLRPALNLVLEKAKKEKRKVAFFLERANSDMGDLDIATVLKIWQAEAVDGGFPTDLLTRIDQYNAAQTLKFRQDIISMLKSKDDAALEAKVKALADPSMKKNFQSALLFLRDLLLNQQDIAVYFERPNRELALRYILNVKNLAIEKKLRLEENPIALTRFWKKRLIMNLKEIIYCAINLWQNK